ncbi:tRNA uridine-5-carboxymethylaminomethyl(34) synthesis GTPase MnmE [Candidatus Spongiihabitans sp.]|uniref:tRNA uridine-5-carboxymethylaminomethyl(34) synthesis GTPase MnmE n=1 Tax=Candidatus Spongiihabitans sp. TaxID=3101308 RepID=UPI003C70492D
MESESEVLHSSDNIVAVTTPPGKGGISIVRLSGRGVPAIARNLVGQCPKPRFAAYADFRDSDNSAIDRGIALFFAAPNSYTGENVLELQGHGSPIVMQMLVRRCLQLGARLARPGEFSERAFLNGRLDLTQAEAIADLIESSTESAARSALKSLQGGFSEKVNELADAVTQLRIFVEAALDFPDEEIDFLADGKVVEQLENLSLLFKSLRELVKQGRLLRDGLKVVLTGLPNAGKSSLLNALSNQDRAIVSAIPGTTRDVLDQIIEIDGLPIAVIDTAGIRETTNEIEAEGVRRALQAQQQADLIILVVDDTNTDDVQAALLLETLLGGQHQSVPVLLVRNKIDLTQRMVQSSENAASENETQENEIYISALTGEGLWALKEKIKRIAGFRQTDDSQFLARQRHVDALRRAEGYLHSGLEQQSNFRAGELLADDLSACQKALGEITGEVTSDDLLGMIFNSFCIGK